MRISPLHAALRWWWIAALGLLAGCEWTSQPLAAPGRARLSSDRVELPVVPDRDFLVVAVTLNGAGPYRLVVDSGADLTVVATDVALASGLKLHGGANVVTPAGQLDFIAGRIDRLQIGGFVAHGVEVAVASVDALAPFRLSRQVDGLLSVGVFRDFLLETDFSRRRVAVERLDSRPLTGIPFVSYEGPKILVTPEVAGRPCPAILDTGNSLGFMIPNVENYPVVQPLTRDPVGFSAVGSAAPMHGQIGRLQGEIRLGPVTWTRPTIRSQAASTLGIIGTEALAGLDLGFDARDRRIYFLRPL